jgi:hypothetical protein
MTEMERGSCLRTPPLRQPPLLTEVRLEPIASLAPAMTIVLAMPTQQVADVPSWSTTCIGTEQKTRCMACRISSASKCVAHTPVHPENAPICSGDLFAVMGGIDNFLLSRAVIFWHNVATDAQRQDYSATPHVPEQPGPCYTARAMAIVHVAMHDAYIGVTKEDTTYLSYSDIPAFTTSGDGAPCSWPAARCPLATACLLHCFVSLLGCCCAPLSAVLAMRSLVRVHALKTSTGCCLSSRFPPKY